jgi:glutamate synthase (NADPH/NADH) large chain
VDDICRQAEEAVDENNNYIILTDRDITEDKAPIPVPSGGFSGPSPPDQCRRKRMQIDIVVESAEPREVMHFALLFGYGASLINPYMRFRHHRTTGGEENDPAGL